MLKVGSVAYLNMLPVVHALFSGQVSWPALWKQATPAELNQAMMAGTLDLAAMSSFAYAEGSEHYYLLPDLSISAVGAVRSIYLLSQVPWEELQGTVRLTPHSASSVHLLRYLLREHPVEYFMAAPEDSRSFIAELLIGNPAIQAYYKRPSRYVYDLGELWHTQTGLPFVFAVWAVRREVAETQPSELAQIYEILLESRRLSQANLPQIAEASYHGVFPNAHDCLAYLKNLKYDWSPALEQGFMRFQEVSHQLGFLKHVRSPRFWFPSQAQVTL